MARRAEAVRVRKAPMDATTTLTLAVLAGASTSRRSGHTRHGRELPGLALPDEPQQDGLLLALRETPAMSVLFAVHLALVASLLVTLPYGKFAHAAFCVAALLHDAIERGR